MRDLDQASAKLAESLESLTRFDAVSGAEGSIGRHMVKLVREVNGKASVERDSFGNVMARLPGHGVEPRRALMLCAHLDEIGFAVRRIEPEGFLRLHKVGSPHIKLVPGRLVSVEGIPGVIGVKSWHQSSPQERTKVVALEELYVDMGASSAAQVREMGIKVGSRVSFLSGLTRIGGTHRFAGKAVDDRVGVLILVELLRRLREPLDWDVVAVFSAQEEVGLRGAAVAAFSLQPDLAISVDNTFAEDTPEYPGTTQESIALGKGPVIHVMEFTDELYRGIISHPAAIGLLERVASSAGIPYQIGFHLQGMTDATAIHLTRSGVPTCSLGVPSRYTHSPVEMFDLADVVACVDLLAGFCKALGQGAEFMLP